MGKTLDQKRAAHAWDCIVAVKADTDNDQKKFGGQTKKMPTRIMTSGLGHSIAFLEAKKYAPKLVETVSEWINMQIPQATGANETLTKRIMNGDSSFLRLATDETLAYLVWLTRFAEAEGLTSDDND